MNHQVQPKELARIRVSELVRNYRRNEADYLRPNYNETQARTDFVTPLLEAFGWDVHNVAGLPGSYREVIEEATVEVGPELVSKRPDYELRLARQRKIFVEAKKPSVSIVRSRDAAFQVRRYGFSASLPIAVLTNFQHIAVYDCRHAPNPTDDANVARILVVGFEEFERRFDELWSMLSREVVYSGEFDKRFEVGVSVQGVEQFDELFLRQVRSWRARLAADMHVHTRGLSAGELTYAVQLFLSRIIFLRICEDREIERYETLKNLPEANTFNALMAELRRADEFYDSGLFRLMDDERLGIQIGNNVLHEIISELYFPQSPYTFAVVEAEVLGEIYEQFLGEEIQFGDDGLEVVVVSKPEVRESGGVFPTPRYIVDVIVERTLRPALEGKGPAELATFTVADICCGSGVFMLSVFELILDHYLAWYLQNDRHAHVGHRIYDAGNGNWRITFAEKRRILVSHLRGVDIDANAVEVAQFSLLLKLIEDENAIGLRDFVQASGERALPPLDGILKSGNSLISQREWVDVYGERMEANLARSINPFDWNIEFPAEMARGGFNVIVGNPPYIRIQTMAAYSPEEVAYYHNRRSPYSTAHQDLFDKYALFVERSISLIDAQGWLGVITPHKFMTTQSGRALRHLIATPRALREVVHFGVKQVFGRKASNYTCILVLCRTPTEVVRVERPGPLEEWRYGTVGQLSEIPSASLEDESWQFAGAEAQAVFDRMRTAHPNRLGAIAEIFVGVQTSADSIYIFKGVAEDDATVTLRWRDQDWPIEKGVLRPCLMDAPLDAFSKPVANSWMIFPYEMVPGPSGHRARLIQPLEMEHRFPGCFAYLRVRRDELEDRNTTGGVANERQFYQFGRSQSLTKFNSPKIILPILSREARYAYDDANTVVTGGGNGPYYMVRRIEGVGFSDFYLLAVLNHPLCEAMVRTNTSTFRGGYYSHGKQFIESLPVPVPTPTQRARLNSYVRQLIEMQEAARDARNPRDRVFLERQVETGRQEIESIVTAIFGLSEADLEVVKAVPIPS